MNPSHLVYHQLPLTSLLAPVAGMSWPPSLLSALLKTLQHPLSPARLRGLLPAAWPLCSPAPDPWPPSAPLFPPLPPLADSAAPHFSRTGFLSAPHRGQTHPVLDLCPSLPTGWNPQRGWILLSTEGSIHTPPRGPSPGRPSPSPQALSVQQLVFIF